MEALGVVPVVVINEAQQAVLLGKVLLEGGLPAAEVTFRTAAAAEAIQAIRKQFPDMLLGAGTVLTVEQAEQAVSSGAEFIVSPGFNPAVVDYCVPRDVPVYPGVCTPTEIEAALAKELDVVKFFPAEAMGGIAYLKAIAAPYSGIRFIPTGGINGDNLGAYLALPFVLACGGSWMVSSELISSGRFDEIARRVEEAVSLVRQLGGGKQWQNE